MITRKEYLGQLNTWRDKNIIKVTLLSLALTLLVVAGDLPRVFLISSSAKTASALARSKQKVFLAMAYSGQADILLFDEPTTYLDISCQIELLRTMSELRKDGKTILTVLHDMNYALKIADQLVVMNQGQIVACGTPDEIYHSHIIDEVFGISIQKIVDQNGNSHYVTDL